MKTMSNQAVFVKHSPDLYQFTTEVDGQLSALKYRQLSQNTLELYTTYVPSSLRGHGIAEHLTVAALEYAKQNGLHVKPACSYVERYMDTHPEWQFLLDTTEVSKKI